MTDLDARAALERLQQRFNEVWGQNRQMLRALSNARDIIHRAHCNQPATLPHKCWKECEEAEDALLEAGWTPEDSRPPERDPDAEYDRMRERRLFEDTEGVAL